MRLDLGAVNLTLDFLCLSVELLAFYQDGKCPGISCLFERAGFWMSWRNYCLNVTRFLATQEMDRSKKRGTFDPPALW